MAHTWWGCSARWRRTELSAGRARLRFLGVGAAAPPPSRAVAPACGSRSSPLAAAGERPFGDPSGGDQQLSPAADS